MMRSRENDGNDNLDNNDDARNNPGMNSRQLYLFSLNFRSVFLKTQQR